MSNAKDMWPQVIIVSLPPLLIVPPTVIRISTMLVMLVRYANMEHVGLDMADVSLKHSVVSIAFNLFVINSSCL